MDFDSDLHHLRLSFHTVSVFLNPWIG
jgi:hypothetical protein